MKIFEVFLKKEGRDPFVHAGSLLAPDAELAGVLARETYSRRREGDRIWVVDRADVIDVDADLVDTAPDRPHARHDGADVAARRRTRREAS